LIASSSQTAPDSRYSTLRRRIATEHAVAYVCANGVLLPSTHGSLIKKSADWRKYVGQTVTRNDGLLLPACRTSDTLLPQPPLALALNEHQLVGILSAESQGILAATILGPPQEKTRNEDFALAASILDRNGASHAFSVVADGVTSKTFWPERSSRIACFIALQVAIDYLQGEAAYSVSDIEAIRHELASHLRRALTVDRRWLTELGAIPAEWDPASFRKFCATDSLWYNTTLLMCLVGPTGGMLLWSGDGAIYIKKDFGRGNVETTTPLRSTDDVTVGNVVSLGDTIIFSGGRLDTAKGLKNLSVTLCTDGPDRTLQRNGDRLAILDVMDSFAVATALEKLTDLPNREIDNYSASVTRWPLTRDKVIPRNTIEHLLWPPVPMPAGQLPRRGASAQRMNWVV